MPHKGSSHVALRNPCRRKRGPAGHRRGAGPGTAAFRRGDRRSQPEQPDAEEIRATDQFDRLVVVDVSDIVEGGEIQALQETLRMTEDGFAEVQTAIEANERFEAEIKQRSIELRRVFAATRSDDGTVTIYVGPTGLVL